MKLISGLAALKDKIKYRRLSFSGASESEKAYFQTQINQSLGKANKDASARYRRMIDRLLSHAKLTDPNSKKVLCLGARNTHEINALRQAGFGSVVGIDLFSASKDILIMDMHNLNFPDNSFDVVFSGDSLEHAHTPRQAAKEVIRVLRPGGYICLSTPIQWRAATGRASEDLSNLADCQDFQSKKEVYSFFDSAPCRVIFDEMYKLDSPADNLLAVLKLNY